MMVSGGDLDVLCYFVQAEDGIRDVVLSRGIGDGYKRHFFFQAEDGIRDLVRSRGLGGWKSVKALRVALGDAVVNRAVCALGGVNEDSFLITIDLAFDGAILKNAELKSQLLDSYHHVMRSSADYFRSKCSKKGWRPAKGSKQEALLLQARWNQLEEQEDQEQTDALDPAGTLITLHVNALRFQPSFDPYNWQSL